MFISQGHTGLESSLYMLYDSIMAVRGSCQNNREKRNFTTRLT